MNKIKVVIICHFSNQEIREKLNLSSKIKYADFAQWISNIIREFINKENVEINIISPHKGMNKFSQNFCINGINYFFYKAAYPFSHNYLQLFYPYFMPLSKIIGFLFAKSFVKRTIYKINPDLVHLVGAENPYYSATVIGLKKYPLLLSTQTVYSNPIRANWVKPDKKRMLIEQAIFKQCKYIIVNASFMPELIKKYNEAIHILKGCFPITKPQIEFASEIIKKYDFVFFARLVPNKGGEDVIKALAIIKKTNPNVSLLFIGVKKANNFSDYLEKLVIDSALQNNVVFIPSIEKQQDLWQKVAEAKIYVLPTKIDTIPGTILESICLGLPVISYKTGDIPSFNSDGETRILLAEKENIIELANLMDLLLNNTKLQKEIALKAKEFIYNKYYNNTNYADNYIILYKAIIENFNQNIAIPENLMYNEQNV